MTKLDHRKASEVLANNFNLNSSTADDYMFLSNYINEAEDLEETYNNLSEQLRRYFKLDDKERYELTFEEEEEYDFLRLKLSMILFGKKAGEQK